MKKVLAIDLGTTFSSVCIVSASGNSIKADKSGSKYIPSIVGFKENKGKVEVQVGKFAQNIQKLHPMNTIYDTKRMLGQRYNDNQIQLMKSKWPFKIEESENGGILICIDQLHKKFKPYEISGEILKYLAYVANSHQSENEQINEVVITIPANFGEAQRLETLKAAEYAKLNVIQILNEPTAAGIAYSIESQKKKSCALIFDFGGGTLDISLLNICDNAITVAGTDGDMFLGGRDFDENTTEYLVKKLGIQTKNSKKLFNFKNEVIEAKVGLSNSIMPSDFTVLDISDFDMEEKEYKLTLEEFEQINQNLINRIIAPIERLLQKVEVSKNDVDSIILVGGSSNMRFVYVKLKEFFNKEPIFSINPSETVVTGAAFVASQKIKGQCLPMKMKNIEFIDICPFSIGTLLSNGSFSKIIKKNSQIPAYGKKRYQTILYRQESFCIKIFEGENKKAKDNVFLTKFSVYNLPPSEDEIEFEIEFNLNENNILTAKVQLVNNNIKLEKQVKIRRINPHSLNVDNNEDDFLMDDFDIFYENIQRFIQFNMNSFLEVYKKAEIDEILNKIKKEKNNKEERPDNPKILADCYKTLDLKKYFRLHSLPKFLY